MEKDLDLITIGRSSVDLYGYQVGGRLEDMRSFQTYIGGSPTNMAAGTARLGLRSALLTKVGDEHMSRLFREELAKEKARRIGPAGITLTERGKGTNTRYINNIAMKNEDYCDSLLVTEVFTPAGHWSSFPSLRHDENDYPRITYLEETYTTA